MAVLDVQRITLGFDPEDDEYKGVEVALAAADEDGDRFLNRDGRTFFMVTNGDDEAVVLTFDSRSRCNEGHEHDVEVSIAAGKTVVLGPFNPEQFSDGDDMVNVSYGGVTTLTVGAFSLSEQGR